MTLQNLDQPGDTQIRRRDQTIARLTRENDELREALGRLVTLIDESKFLTRGGPEAERERAAAMVEARKALNTEKDTG